MSGLGKKISQLSPDLQREVLDFIEFLLKRAAKKKRCKPSFEWAGALSELREKDTSTELQHKISKWRIGEQ